MCSSDLWAAAASFRGTDMRGGANGARVRLDPQRNWAVNDPKELARTLATLEKIQQDFNASCLTQKIPQRAAGYKTRYPTDLFAFSSTLQLRSSSLKEESTWSREVASATLNQSNL